MAQKNIHRTKISLDISDFLHFNFEQYKKSESDAGRKPWLQSLFHVAMKIVGLVREYFFHIYFLIWNKNELLLLSFI